MNSELSTTIYHSWYICALFFYSHGNYSKARQYIRQFYKCFYFHGDVVDTRQEVRAKILEAQILFKCDPNTRNAQLVLDEAIEVLKNVYLTDSFWFIEPYTLYEYIDNRFSKELVLLKEKYVNRREDAFIQLRNFIKEVEMNKPTIK